MHADCPIGVFDSGYGGLTILKEVVKLMPEYDYIYLGDNARTPYGTRSFDVVYNYTREAVLKLFEMGCRLVVLACNTASAKALRTLQQRDLPAIDSSLRVLGVIRPSIEVLAAYSKNRHVGVLATKGTVSSESYLMETAKLYGDGVFSVSQVACPMLAPLVEGNELECEGTAYFVKKYMDDLFAEDDRIDTIVLGCTHYPLLKKLILKYAPSGVKILEQGGIVAESLKNYLFRHPEITDRISRHSDIRYLTTEHAALFEEMAEVFMGRKIRAEQVRL